MEGEHIVNLVGNLILTRVNRFAPGIENICHLMGCEEDPQSAKLGGEV
jgi:hypothetical protein